MAKIKDKMIQSVSANKVVQDNANQFVTLTQKQLFDLLKSNGLEVTISSHMLPESNTIDIGSPTKRFRSIYVDEAYLSANTLYVDGVPVIQTKNESIEFNADPGQGISVRTTGTGSSKVSSENSTEISATGVGAIVGVKATGEGGSVNLTASSIVNVSAPDVNLKGAVAVTDLLVKGALRVAGTTTTIDSENLQVKDNIIDINKDDIGNGVSRGTAGLRVLRGDLEPYYVLFDELDDLFKVGTASGLEVLATRTYVDQKIAEVKTYIDEKINSLGWSLIKEV